MVMLLEPERAAQLVAERLARPVSLGARAEGWRVGRAPHLEKDWLVRRTLEELGIHCEADAGLQDLKGFMIASPRGAEIVVSERLGEDERLGVYAHLLAHALLEQGEVGEV